ncbi:DUF1963 domain-containing protein [Tropicibacter sp. R15_0]|uniref:DUF1963 domain-containing protein n=1 Tax=Tropicibacter sp. R15_0 TaxID=2821101 RepID=UPI001ADC9508|nr:DUF1963 domain-containing protein [Tropicibacter sp. R15_0]MBO9468374.1 DUF1963 domain-containing protein [Tropicibacter sp. R15_0]
MKIDAFKTKYAAELGIAKQDLLALVRPCVPFDAIKRSSGNEPGLFESRLGGNPAWPKEHPLPRDSNGDHMVFVFQFNLADFKGLDGFPNSGLLQLFLGNDTNERGITGIPEYRKPGDYPLHNGDAFQLVYHDKTDGLVETAYPLPEAEFKVYTPEIAAGRFGILAGEVCQMIPPIDEMHGTDIFNRFASLPEVGDDHWELFGFLSETLWREQLDIGLHLGGYANPLQLDQRSFFKEYRKYDRCLISFAEMEGLDLPDMVFSVLISDQDLKERRFDDVVLIADTD